MTPAIALLEGGVALAYDESGSGTPLLFIHGWPFDRTFWSPQLSGLQTQARCIAPDLRGFGESTVTAPYTIAQYADDVAALLAKLGVDRAMICGLSMGGYVAFELLRRHPALVRALILVSTRATIDSDAGRAKRRELAAFGRDQGVVALAHRQLPTAVGATTLATRPEVAVALERLMASSDTDGVVAAQLAMADRRDSTGLLSRITVPTLVVSGEEDTTTPPDEMRRMAAEIPNARFEVIPLAGHACSFERPAAFNHIVSEFLAGLLYA